ncbi:MAG: ATP-grasp domain-containing protein [Alphaproteobacteria bacterium]|nr:ATP-grasp domain-containing protein [Alphaproteobacteria bacterium]
MTKRLLVLGGSRQALRGLEQILDLGLELVVCDYDPSAPGFDLAHHTILASVYHLDQCLPAIQEFHQKLPLDGVMCLACDVPHVVARIAQSLNLPGIPVDVADLFVDKFAMKERLVASGISVPPYAIVTAAQDLDELLEKWQMLVVKPVDSRGSKGVSILDDRGQAEWAFRHAKEMSPSGRVMAEKFLSGPQLSTESILCDGQAVTPALSDRCYEYLEKYKPFIVENGGDMPSRLSDEILDAVRALISSASKALGVSRGIVKGDIVVHEGRPYVIELAARLSGGYFCTHQIPYSTGVKLVEACARQALGERLEASDWHGKYERFVSTRWLIPSPGVIESVPAASEICGLKGVLAFDSWVSAGDVVGGAENAAASVAMVQATGNTRAEAIAAAQNALDAFTISVKS